MQRKLVVACAVTGLFICIALLMALTIGRSNVSARSLHKRLKIYDVQYFPGKSFSYVYPKLWIRLHPLLRQLGWRSPFTLSMSGTGPVFIVLAHIAVGTPKYVYLLSDDGRSVSLTFPLLDVSRTDTNLFLLRYNGFNTGVDALTNGIYRLRLDGETNDVAVIRIR